MKAKLIKKGEEYHLWVNDIEPKIVPFAKYPWDITKQKLSLKNCQAIERGHSPSELSKVLTEGERGAFEFGYCLAREHNGNKKFSEEDLDKAFELGKYVEREDCTENYLAYKQSLQQTEWDVEIEMEFVGRGKHGIGSEVNHYMPKRDAEGCLILKRV